MATSYIYYTATSWQLVTFSFYNPNSKKIVPRELGTWTSSLTPNPLLGDKKKIGTKSNIQIQFKS